MVGAETPGGAAAGAAAGAGDRRAPLRLWTQFLLGTVGVVGATCAALGILLAAFFGHYFATARLNALTTRTSALIASWEMPPVRGQPRITALVHDTGGYVWILGPGGRTLAEFGAPGFARYLDQVTPAEMTDLLQGEPLHRVTGQVPGQSWRLALVGLPLSHGARDGGQAVLWLAPVRGQDIFAAVAARLAVVAAAGLLLAVALSAWLAARLARPIRLLEEAAGHIAAGMFNADIAEQGPAEVRSLARSLRRMASQLSDLDRHRREFLADVSHELRTPLAAVHGALESMRSSAGPADGDAWRYLDTAMHETARMGRLVDDLLALARAQAGRLTLQRRSVDFTEAMLRVALSLEPISSLRGVAFRFEALQAAVAVDADPDRLSQVLWNLLDNASRYTPAGAEAVVCLTVEGGDALLQVRNPGRVLSAEDVARLFLRFERSDTERGAGLGLAIARTLVLAHGGSLAAECPPDGGLAVRLRWPLAAGASGRQRASGTGQDGDGGGGEGGGAG